MTADRKKPGVAFYTTIVVVLVLAYPLTFGPACWITSRTNVGADLVPVVYRPLTWAVSAESDTTINRVSTWYAKFAAAENWYFLPAYEVENPVGPEQFVGWMWVPAGPVTPGRIRSWRAASRGL